MSAKPTPPRSWTLVWSQEYRGYVSTHTHKGSDMYTALEATPEVRLAVELHSELVEALEYYAARETWLTLEHNADGTFRQWEKRKCIDDEEIVPYEMRTGERGNMHYAGKRARAVLERAKARKREGV